MLFGRIRKCWLSNQHGLLYDSSKRYGILSAVRFFFMYSILTVLLLIYLYYVFHDHQKGFGWSIDSLPVQLPMFAYLREHVRAFWNAIFDGTSTALYDYRIGMGGDSLTFLSVWYLEPVSFIGVLAPPHMIEAFYDALVLLRIYLTGLSFGILCLYEKKRNVIPMVIGSLIYAFSGWMFFYIRHPVFYAALIYLPILIIAAKEVLRGGRGILFVLTVALSAWTHYYYLYVNTLLLFFLLVIEIASGQGMEKKRRLWQIYAIMWRYCLGISIAMIVFLPNIVAFFNSNRMAAHLETRSFLKFETGWIHRLITGLITPFFSAGHWLHNGFISFGLISLFLCVFWKKDKKLYIWSLLVSIGMMMPAVTFLFSGFSAIQFRWNYAAGLLMAYAVVSFWDDKTEALRNVVLLLLPLAVYVGIPILFEDMNHKYLNSATAFLGLYTLLILFFRRRSTSRLFQGLLLAVVLANIVRDIDYTFLSEHGNYIEEFVPRGKSVEIITDEPEAASYAIEDDSFYRVNSPRLKVENENSAVFLNNHGISFYNNVMDKNIADYYHGLENVNTRLLDTIDHDSRTILDALASVKYYLVYEEDASYVPYGYEYIKSVEGTDIYRNKYALPLGYSYTEVIPYDRYMSLTALERQEVLMKAAVLEKDTTLQNHAYESIIVRDDAVTFAFHGCEYDSETGICMVTEPGGYFTVRYNRHAEAETYLRLGGLDIDDYYDAYWKIRIYNDSVDKEVELRSSTATYSYGNYDYLINLGYNSAETEINIAFPFVCEIRLDSVEVFHQPMTDYADDCMERKKDELENVEIGANFVEGDFVATQDELCVISIPYSTGWTAFVDGREQEILRANVTFMGLLLEAGEHHIVLRYCTPGLRPGAIISACGICVLIAYMIFYRQRNGVRESVANRETGVEDR